MENLDPISPEPKFSSGPNLDLLALEAENKRLRVALDSLLNSFIDLNPTGEDINCEKHPGYLKGLEALTTPAPDTSGLWKVLAVASRYLVSHTIQHPCPCPVCESVAALTLELQALIKEMTK